MHVVSDFVKSYVHCVIYVVNTMLSSYVSCAVRIACAEGLYGVPTRSPSWDSSPVVKLYRIFQRNTSFGFRWPSLTIPLSNRSNPVSVEEVFSAIASCKRSSACGVDAKLHSLKRWYRLINVADMLRHIAAEVVFVRISFGVHPLRMPKSSFSLLKKEEETMCWRRLKWEGCAIKATILAAH